MSTIRQIKKLSYERYEALIGYTKLAIIGYVAEELIAYTDAEERVIGVLLFDKNDLDYNCILLARDENRRFRCFQVETSIPDEQMALQQLYTLIDEFSDKPDSYFFQGDTQKAYVDLFEIKEGTDESKLHPSFLAVKSSEGFSAAKELINEIMPHFQDVDNGQFLADFQSKGFDQRIWELYLFCYFNEERLDRSTSNNRPDFTLSHLEKSLAIEATTLGRPEDISNVPSTNDIEAFTIYMRQRFSNSLRKKLRKRYWELEHLQETSLAFAIADFHTETRRDFETKEIEGPSLHSSQTALWQYLYGIEIEEVSHREQGIVPVFRELPNDQDNGRKYGFFNEENSENISAVISSRVGTIAKFNRMGRLAGFGSKNVHQIIQALIHDPDPHASLPIGKVWDINDEDYYEFWSTGIEVYHNPNARIPLDPMLLPGAFHNRFQNGRIESSYEGDGWHPYQMQTVTIIATSELEYTSKKMQQELEKRDISNPWNIF